MSRPLLGGLDDNSGKWGEMPSLSHCLALASASYFGEPRFPLDIGQDLFDQPTVANVYAEAKWTRPRVGPVALSATATDNDFGVLVRRALTWLS